MHADTCNMHDTWTTFCIYNGSNANRYTSSVDGLSVIYYHIYSVVIYQARPLSCFAVTEAIAEIILYSQSLPKASLQGHHHPCPCDGLHLDHWAVCSGRGGKGLCLSLCHCQCISGEKALVEHGYTKLCNIYISNAFQMTTISISVIHVDGCTV